MHRFAHLSTATGLALFGAVLGWRFSGIAFLGWDAYPILAAAGPGSETGLLGIFGRPMADGLLPMSFYRPLLSLSIALEWPLWGLDAAGYVVTNAALFGLSGLTLHALLLRFGATWPMALGAILFFILHTVVPDVVPYLPRRPELLCTLFVLVALLLDHLGRYAPPGSRSTVISRALIAGAWLATAAAALSKETAIVLPVLIATARWLFPAPERHGSSRSPRAQALRGFAAHGAVLAIVLVLRLQTLGSLGGYPDSDVTLLPELWLKTVAKVLLGVFLAGDVLPSIALVLLVLGIAVLSWQKAATAPTSRLAALLAWLGPSRARLAAFAVVWILSLATVYAAAARLSPWYLLIVVCGAAIGFGLVIDLALSSLRKRASSRATPAAVLLGSALLLTSFAAGSPLVRPPEEFRHASRELDSFLGQLEEHIRQAPDDPMQRARTFAGSYPRLVIGSGGRQVPVLVAHSLAGWARIAFPRRRIVFLSRDQHLAEPPPEATVVELGRGIHRNLRDKTSE